jgi:hypothetical protein
MVIEIELRVGGFAEAHPVALAFLVLFAVIDDKGGAILKVKESFEEIRVELEVAGGRARALPRAHAADGEGARSFVAVFDLLLVAEEGHDHVASDTQLVGVLSVEQAAQGPDKARVRQGSGDGGRKASNDGINRLHHGIINHGLRHRPRL